MRKRSNIFLPKSNTSMLYAYKKEQIMTYDVRKYDNKEKRSKLSSDFDCIAQHMHPPEHAQSLGNQILNSPYPRRIIIENKTTTKAFNHVISYCNTVLNADKDDEDRNNPRLRTAIRRIYDYHLTVSEALDCQNVTNLVDFTRSP